MPGVFISYRRHDSAGHTGRLFDRLQARLGRDRVFMDITGIDPGVDFAQTIEGAVASCDVLLAIIGPEWLTCTDAAGHRRLDDQADFIRVEISAALERGVPVIPVLIAGASIPPPPLLPEGLKLLGRRQTVELRDTRWDADTSDLMTTMEGLLGVDRDAATAARQRKLAFLLAGALTAALAIALPAAWYLSRDDDPASPTPATAPAVPARLLEYSLMVRPNPTRRSAVAPTPVAGTRILSAGDLVRFSFSSPQPGFLYVINEGPPDSERRTAFNVLFPSPTSNSGSARLAPGQVVLVPERGDGFELDVEQGTEKLWLIWSARSLDELGALKQWANRQDQGQIQDPRDVDLVRNFLSRHAQPEPEVQQNDDATRTTITAQGDMLVKLVTLEHRQ